MGLHSLQRLSGVVQSIVILVLVERGLRVRDMEGYEGGSGGKEGMRGIG
jgi:hypothetical protein